MASSNQPKRLKISPEGELPALDDLLHDQDAAGPQSQTAPLFCTECGTPNPNSAKYCRKCGQALALQELRGVPSRSTPRLSDALTVAKRKNDAKEMALAVMRGERGQREAKSGREEMNLWAMILRVSTIVFIAGIAISAAVTNQGISAWVAIPALIIWFLIEGVRSQRRNISLWEMASSVTTAVFIAGIAITAIVVGGGYSAWIAIPAMIVWFLVEGVRNG